MRVRTGQSEIKLPKGECQKCHCLKMQDCVTAAMN